LAAGPLRRSARPFAAGQQWLKDPPLPVGQIFARSNG
jgi:hypothetical protein